MSEYRPQQRRVSARIFTDIGWVTGTFHCSIQESLVEHLNKKASFYRITDARLPGSEKSLDFFALQRERVILVAPSPEEQNLVKPLPGDLNQVYVSCVLGDGIVTGNLQWAMHPRLSDYLVNHHGYLVLRGCVLRARTEARGVMKQLPIALINDRSVVGLCEGDPDIDHGARDA